MLRMILNRIWFSHTNLLRWKEFLHNLVFFFYRPVDVGFLYCLCFCYSPEIIFMTHFFQTIFLWSLIGTPACLRSLPLDLNSTHPLHGAQSPKMKSHERSCTSWEKWIQTVWKRLWWYISSQDFLTCMFLLEKPKLEEWKSPFIHPVVSRCPYG